MIKKCCNKNFAKNKNKYNLKSVTCYVSFVKCHQSPVTCHQRQQPQPHTLSLIIPHYTQASSPKQSYLSFGTSLLATTIKRSNKNKIINKKFKNSNKKGFHSFAILAIPSLTSPGDSSSRRMAHAQTDIATYRLNRGRGQFSQNMSGSICAAETWAD